MDACDIIKQSKIMRNALNITSEISKLNEFSPKHDRTKARVSSLSTALRVL